MLYKQYQSTFDEIFFVVTGSKVETTAETCQYENVLCIQYEDLMFSNEQNMKTLVNDLTEKIQARFQVGFCILIVVNGCTHFNHIVFFHFAFAI